MDYAIMLKSIKALRPYFAQLAVMSYCECLPEASQLQSMGIEAEKQMLAATGGVNTHRGALFSVGLAVVAACHILATGCSSNFLDQWSKIVTSIASQMPGSDNSHGNSVKAQHNVAGALDIARTGYSEMVNKWLKYYCDNCNDEHIKHKTLLLIMCSLDDTNVIHRAGFEMAQQVKQEAAHLLENFSIEGLEQMNQSFIARNISPGGAADMLSLTLFLSTLTKQDNN
jgi:triphosphoribosyl-dephospho-CoA synthetase